ncbi:MAG: SLOG family protein [Hominenteromicrobium sp.]
MKVAILGSRGISNMDLDLYFPQELAGRVTEVVSGGAKGMDTCARLWAQKRGYACREFLPDYRRYRRGAPLKRNQAIIDYCDCAVFYWDGESRGTKYTIGLCRKMKKLHFVYLVSGRDGEQPLLLGLRAEGEAGTILPD